MTGVMINSTDYAYKKQVSGVAADIASQSKDVLAHRQE
jgi:hypothetical protein